MEFQGHWNFISFMRLEQLWCCPELHLAWGKMSQQGGFAWQCDKEGSCFLVKPS